MTINATDDTAFIVPDTDILDDEQRALVCFVQAIQAAQHYQRLTAEARARRGAATTDLEADRDTLLDLERGYTRALGRRARDVGKTVFAKGLKRRTA